MSLFTRFKKWINPHQADVPYSYSVTPNVGVQTNTGNFAFHTNQTLPAQVVRGPGRVYARQLRFTPAPVGGVAVVIAGGLPPIRQDFQLQPLVDDNSQGGQ